MKRVLVGVMVAGVMAIPASPAGSAPPQVRSAPPCLHEDGSGQTECVWDARRRGNGKGRSLILTDIGPDRAVVISHARARKMVRRWRAENCVRVTRRDFVCRGWNRG